MNNKNLVLGFDFGMKYIGVASGNLITRTATALTALIAQDGIPKWPELEALISEWRPSQLIVGFPLNMDGSPQEVTYCARKFARRLEARYRLPVTLVDERLSSWEAEALVGKKDLKRLNATAAQIIVERWLTNS